MAVNAKSRNRFAGDRSLLGFRAEMGPEIHGKPQENGPQQPSDRIQFLPNCRLCAPRNRHYEGLLHGPVQHSL